MEKLYNIPEYPEKIPLSFDHKDLVDEYNCKHLQYSGLVFSNLFLIGEDDIFLSKLHDCLLVSQNDSFGNPVISILGDNWQDGVKELSTEPKLSFFALPYSKDVTLDEKNSDYIYNIQELVNSEGKEYQSYRRKQNQLAKHGSIQIRLATTSDLDDIWHLTKQWFDGLTQNKEHKSLARFELVALEKALLFKDKLNIAFQVFVLEGDIVGFVCTEGLCTQTLLIHFFKTKKGIQGCAESCFAHLAKANIDRFTQINFQQDLGIDGLAQFKKSLRPLPIGKIYEI